MLHHLTRIPGFRRLWLRCPLGSAALRAEYDVWDRPNYAYGIYSWARLARSLGLSSLSVIEFGVAGGNGLLSMERIADEISSWCGVKIAVFGFDTGSGMPPPRDYRDLPHVWQQGFYQMDATRLRSRLRHAELILGDVAATTREFVTRADIPPIGFISFDLDYYSSTRDAFHIFSGSAASRLPRVYCYFDDIVWPEHACHNEFTGELCAIREFNQGHEMLKIAQLANLSWMRRHPARWNEQIYVLHDFQHPQYGDLVTHEGEKYRQRRLA